VIPLLEYLKNKFPSQKIIFVFHRGIGTDKYTGRKRGEKLSMLARKIKEMGFEYKDISYSPDGFNIYDDCDLHIGFRVHAHIYTLSKRRKSILISSDLRGDSFNQTVGLPCINAFNELYPTLNNRYLKKAYRIFSNVENDYLFKELDGIFEFIHYTNGKVYEWAFSRMRYYFDAMVAHIKTLEIKLA
jgi:hypothetical protein